MTILLVVAAALINSAGEILLAQRPEGKRLARKWEFPGGKIEAGESPETAIVRELREELGIDVEIESLEPFWFLSHDYTNEFGFHLLMPVYLVRRWKGEPQALEHQAILWKDLSTIHEIDTIRADAELIDKLAKYFA